MDLLLYNTPAGLKPMYDDDYDNKKKLKIGETYRASIKLARNIDFHRKYFSLIKTAWEYQNENTQKFFYGSMEAFRKTVEVAAGHSEKVYSIAHKEWIDVPKSIAFSKMDEIAFRELYERVKDVLFQVFLKNISEDEFMSNLIDY